MADCLICVLTHPSAFVPQLRDYGEKRRADVPVISPSRLGYAPKCASSPSGRKARYLNSVSYAG